MPSPILRFHAVAAMLFLACSVAPAEPRKQDAAKQVAIVEEVSSGLRGVRQFDLLSSGRTIDLGASGRIVLGYRTSCWQDTITGGVVTVELQDSRAEGGRLLRRRVECDASGLAWMNSASAAAGRGVVVLSDQEAPEADVVLFGLSPIVAMKKGGASLSIERLDRPGELLRFDLGAAGVDLFDRGLALEARGVYRFAIGDKAIIVRVDDLAEPGRAPAVGRLLIFHD
jgi:hypothetical protein